MSGLRTNELWHLTTDHLDLEQSGLILDAKWTKNREQGLQPIPATLAEHLYEFAPSGEPERLYATLNVYGRVPKERLSGTVEKLGETLLPQEKCATYVHQNGEDRGINATSTLQNNMLDCAIWMENRGFEPLTSAVQRH